MFARIGLRDEHVVNVHADAGGIPGVERVLRVDECHDATHGLRLGEDLK